MIGGLLVADFRRIVSGMFSSPVTGATVWGLVSSVDVLSLERGLCFSGLYSLSSWGSRIRMSRFPVRPLVQC